MRTDASPILSRRRAPVSIAAAPGVYRHARLERYGAGEAHPPHAHEHSSISILLAGDFQEVLGGCEYDFASPVLGWKPAGLSHADRFGPWGAMFASIPVPDDCHASISLPAGWHALSNFRSVGPLVRLSLAGGAACVRQDALVDLLAMAGPPGGARRGDVPAWLNRAREMLRDDPANSSLDTLSCALGVHRVHLSRRFTRQFGIPPSIYRLRSMIAQSLGVLEDKRSTLLEAANSGGFADYSHAARSVRSTTGFGIGEIRSLLG